MVLVLTPDFIRRPSALVPKIHRSKPAGFRLCRNTVSRSLFPSLSLYRTSRRMWSAAIQPTLSCFFNLKATSPSSFCHQKLLVSLKNPVIPSRYPCQLNIGSPFSISAASAFSLDTLNPDSISPNPSSRKKKLGVVVKPMEKPRLVLKFIWMQKNIGISIDQVIPGYGTIPLSPYYFWPRKDAWEELKTLLERKSWISQKQMVVLLNQATDIINLWQQSGGDFT